MSRLVLFKISCTPDGRRTLEQFTLLCYFKKSWLTQFASDCAICRMYTQRPSDFRIMIVATPGSGSTARGVAARTGHAGLPREDREDVTPGEQEAAATEGPGRESLPVMRYGEGLCLFGGGGGVGGVAVQYSYTVSKPFVIVWTAVLYQ